MKKKTHLLQYEKKNHNPGKKYHDGHNLKSTKLTPVKEKVISQEGEYFSPVITEPEACKEYRYRSNETLNCCFQK